MLRINPQMSVLSRRNEETYGIPAILRIIPAKVSEGTGLQRVASCLPEKSYGHVILIVTLKKMNCAFKKPLQKKKKILIRAICIPFAVALKVHCCSFKSRQEISPFVIIFFAGKCNECHPPCTSYLGRSGQYLFWR